MSDNVQMLDFDKLTPWQGCIDKGWTRMQAKRAFEIVLGKMLQPLAKNPEDEEVPYLKAQHVQWRHIELDELPTMWATLHEIEQLNLSIGDLLVCEGGEVGRAARLNFQPPEKCIIQNALHRVRDKKLGHVGFLNYCLWQAAEKGWFDVLCNRATIAHFTVEKFRDLWLNLPSVELQKNISDYLDAETARIDALIAEKEEMLNLLAEKRAALVSKTVTQGLDSNVSMKPSGLDWLDVIPLHWQIKRFKHFARIGNGSTPNREKPHYWEGGDFPWLNSSVVNSRIVSEASRYVTTDAITECHLPQISPPALLVAITGQGKTRGKSAVLNFEATINQHLAFIQPFPQTADCLYLSFLLDSAYLFIRSNSDGSGSTRGAITCEQLSNFYVPLPPYKEQLEILKYIDEQISEFELIQENLLRSVSLLKERRSALITAAVTGRLCAK